MSNHKHEQPPVCKHVLKYCEECDVVECTKCGKEWGNDSQTATITPGTDWQKMPYIPPVQPLPFPLNPPYKYVGDFPPTYVTCSSKTTSNG